MINRPFVSDLFSFANVVIKLCLQVEQNLKTGYKFKLDKGTFIHYVVYYISMLAGPCFLYKIDRVESISHEYVPPQHEWLYSLTLIVIEL